MKNITFGRKLTGGFMIVAFLAALVGGVGIFNIRIMDKADTKLYEKFTVPIGQLQEMISSFLLIRLTLQELLPLVPGLTRNRLLLAMSPGLVLELCAPMWPKWRPGW